jgi:hypothetical protein
MSQVVAQAETMVAHYGPDVCSWHRADIGDVRSRDDSVAKHLLRRLWKHDSV